MPFSFLLSLFSNYGTRTKRRVHVTVHSHPRTVAGVLATLLLGVVSTVMLVADVGTAFGAFIPVMSGVQLLSNDPPNARSSPGVSSSLFDVLSGPRQLTL